jgi:RimJ/RimL family protein N-acetyltransferase
MKVELEEYSVPYLNASWLWLNDPEIRKLTNTPVLTKDSQLRWYETLSEKEDYKIWGISFNNKPIGACGLKKITNEDAEYWGYIGEKELWGKGLGKVIMHLMEEEARKLYLNNIWLQVLKENERAIKLYISLGYISEKEEHNLIFMRKEL